MKSAKKTQNYLTLFSQLFWGYRFENKKFSLGILIPNVILFHRTYQVWRKAKIICYTTNLKIFSLSFRSAEQLKIVFVP